MSSPAEPGPVLFTRPASPAGEDPGAVTFDSLATWRELVSVLVVSGPRQLGTSRRYRSAVHARFARLPVLG